MVPQQAGTLPAGDVRPGCAEDCYCPPWPKRCRGCNEAARQRPTMAVRVPGRPGSALSDPDAPAWLLDRLHVVDT